MPRPPIPVSAGTRFGRLVVLADRVGKEPTVLVACDCASAPKRVRAHALTERSNPPLRSCGCLGRETRTGGERGPKPVVVHGGARRGKRDPLFGVWRDLRRRHPGEVASEWASFAEFRDDVGERPDGAVLRRVDESRPWGPGNVAWACFASSGFRTTPRSSTKRRSQRSAPCLDRGVSRRTVAKVRDLALAS